MQKMFISYAWAIGCWKSTITNFISTKVWLPTFNNDAIRSEVATDFSWPDETEAIKRIKKRLNSTIKEWKSFIYDASVDRTRWTLKNILIKNWYKFFIISIDLNKETLLQSYKRTSNFEAIKKIDNVYEDHQKFLNDFDNDINIHINETNYQNRLKNVYRMVSQWVKNLE